MWMDAEGIAHTVALPDPTDAMSEEFRLALDRLISADREAIEAVVEAAEEQVYEALSGFVRSDEAHFEGLPAPLELLEGSPQTAHDLADLIARIDLRWRLDAVMAIVDHVDSV
jgi:hypothetical protein